MDPREQRGLLIAATAREIRGKSDHLWTVSSSQGAGNPCYHVNLEKKTCTCLDHQEDKGYIGGVPHFNSIFNIFDAPDTTAILTDLVAKTAAPLKSLESTFAIDSSGFSGCKFDRWFDEKWGEINHQPGSRGALEAQHGQVWDTDELRADFEVLGFAAPLVVVRRVRDRVKGSLYFQHNPRFYFGFQADM